MKKTKRSHGINKSVKGFLKILEKSVVIRTTNNWRKIHGKPMRRKYANRL